MAMVEATLPSPPLSPRLPRSPLCPPTSRSTPSLQFRHDKNLRLHKDDQVLRDILADVLPDIIHTCLSDCMSEQIEALNNIIGQLNGTANPERSQRHHRLIRQTDSYVSAPGDASIRPSGVSTLSFPRNSRYKQAEDYRSRNNMSTDASELFQKANAFNKNARPIAAVSSYEDSLRIFIKKFWTSSWALPCIRKEMSLMMRSHSFSLFIGFCIMLNVLLVGVETEMQAATGEGSDFIRITMLILSALFVAEVVLRIFAEGTDFFTEPGEKMWNLLDAAIALGCIIDLLIFQEAMTGQVLRTVRIARILRGMRLARWLNQLREFRKMIFAMTVSMRTLVWAIVLLLFLVYGFAIWFTSQCVEAVGQGLLSAEVSADSQRHFGSLSKSMLTLWMVITGGYNWINVITPLWEVDSVLAVLFLAYIAVAVLGVMNIVTSVFVESAMTSTMHYRDLMQQEKSRAKHTLSKHLKHIFESIDCDYSGMISMDELQTFLHDESLQLQEYFEALEIDAEDATVLFKLLDKDNSGEIDVHEFCDGCMRLKGDAKSFDMNCLIYMMKKAQTKIMKITSGMDIMLGLQLDTLSDLSRVTGVRDNRRRHRAEIAAIFKSELEVDGHGEDEPFVLDSLQTSQFLIDPITELSSEAL